MRALTLFLDPPLQLYAEPSMIHWLKTNYKVEDLIIVSPDAGGAKRYAASCLLTTASCHLVLT